MRLLVRQCDVEHVAARAEGHGLAVAGHVHELDVLRRVDEALLDPPVVGGDPHRDLARRAAGRVQEMQVAVLHVDDPPSVARGRHDVDVRVARDLPHRARPELLRPQVGDAVGRAVGAEVHGVAHPHRVGVAAHVVRDLLEALRREVVHPDVGVLAALVTLPVVVLVALAHVEHPRAVRREACALAAVHRQRFRHRGVEAYPVELLVARDRRDAEARAEHDVAAVGGPGHHQPPERAPRQPLRRPAARGDHEHVGRVVVESRVGDPLPVGRDLRRELQPRVARQTHGRSAVEAGRVEIPVPGEHDPLAADVGVAHEAGLVGHDGPRRRRTAGRRGHEQAMT